MISVSPNLATLMVAAIRDAMKYNEGLLRSETIRDVTDIEEYLVSLGMLEMEVKRQYEKMEKDEGLPPYESLWP